MPLQTKRCSACSQEKELTSYSKYKSAPDGLGRICVECRRKHKRTFYLKHRERVKDEVQARKASLRDWYKSLKTTLSCNRCGENHPATLVFHHTDPSEKEYAVSQMIDCLGCSKERILDEISKCEVLCANCHAKHHFAEAYCGM